jgi:hypothetical protein
MREEGVILDTSDVIQDGGAKGMAMRERVWESRNKERRARLQVQKKT